MTKNDVRQIREATRSRFSAREKIRIVLERLRGEEFTVYDGQAYLAAYDPGLNWIHLWSSDGTTAGTGRVSETVKGVWPGRSIPVG